MTSRTLGASGTVISAVGLGGHEFSTAGRIRGLHDDVAKALTPGTILPGFGGPERRTLLRSALARGVTLFDVTIDSEKEALGRLLSELGAGPEVLVQTRPDGFVYTYDPGNRAFLERDRLLREIERICGLLRRPRVDILNVGISGASLQAPGYLDRLAASLDALRSRGLVSLFACDTFSGEGTYLSLIDSGLFDILYVIYGPLADGAERRLLPAAAARGMGVIVKEPFLKGDVFRAADAGGLSSDDHAAVAGAALRWILRRAEISSIVVGVRDERELVIDLSACDATFDDEDRSLLAAIAANDLAAAVRSRRERDLSHGSEPLASLSTTQTD